MTDLKKPVHRYFSDYCYYLFKYDFNGCDY